MHWARRADRPVRSARRRPTPIDQPPDGYPMFNDDPNTRSNLKTPTSTEANAVETRFFTFGDETQPFRLQSGQALAPVTLAYEMYGELNEARDNVILLFHTLTGSHHAAGYNPGIPEIGDRWTDECKLGWWNDFIGPDRALNTDRFCVLCVNYIGGCYGSTGPSSINPRTGKPYGSQFPAVTITDIVDSQVQLLDHLGIDKLHGVTGGSLGGMASLTFAVRYPERVDIVAPIASGHTVSTLQRIHNFEQIFAIEKDPHFHGGDYYGGPAPDDGLELARMIAHKTYVSLHTLADRAGHQVGQEDDEFSHYRISSPIESYLLHHVKKFVRRFDANSYLRILEAWQHFDLLQNQGGSSLEEIFEQCRHQQYMVFSIDSDVSFYPEEQADLVRLLKHVGIPAQHITVHSDKGHDAFLLEPAMFTPHLVYTFENGW